MYKNIYKMILPKIALMSTRLCEEHAIFDPYNMEKCINYLKKYVYILPKWYLQLPSNTVAEKLIQNFYLILIVSKWNNITYDIDNFDKTIYRLKEKVDILTDKALKVLLF